MSLQDVLFGAAIANRQVLNSKDIRWEDPDVEALILLMRDGKENDPENATVVRGALNVVIDDNIVGPMDRTLKENENVLGAIMRIHDMLKVRHMRRTIANRISLCVTKLLQMEVLQDDASEREAMIKLAQEIEAIAKG